MIFAILPRFIYKQETAGSPFMYLYKNMFCTNPFIVGLTKIPVVKIYHSRHLHINNILYLGHGFCISMTRRNKIPRAQITTNNLMKIMKLSWKLKYFKHSNNTKFIPFIKYMHNSWKLMDLASYLIF